MRVALAAMRAVLLVLAGVVGAGVIDAGAAAAQAGWLIAVPQTSAVAGEPFEIVVVAPPGGEWPETLSLSVKSDVEEITLPAQALGPAQDGRRTYRVRIPAGLTGVLTLSLPDQASNSLLLVVGNRPDEVQQLTGERAAGALEPPLSANDPMYFVVGPRGGWSARFQLSFKYRLFDLASGFGREHPWLSGLYFGYTQTSIWDLSSTSKVFYDTSYRPSFFWKWDRVDEQTFIDGLRLGVEHESNGKGGVDSRSINIAFFRPEWRWKRDNGAELEFTPKLYAYLDKSENPDIDRYRGHVDWRLRYDNGGRWITTALARIGRSGKGSLLLDLSRRSRDVRFGPLSGYLHLQFFTGYGESIIDYNVRRTSQVRVGFAIVP